MFKMFSKHVILGFCTLVLLSIAFILLQKDTKLKLLQVVQKSREPTFVIVLAYYRSGSTFTADIIQQSPDVFFIYEPLMVSENWYFSKDMFCVATSGTCRYPKVWKHDPSFAKSVISNIFSCKMRDLRKEVLNILDMTHMRSKDQSFLHKCTRSRGIEFCLQTSDKTCSTRAIRLVKTIRLRFDIAEELLKAYPTLKIVHLIRDPRGMLESRRRGHEDKKPFNLKAVSEEACNRLLYDVSFSRKLQQAYNGRIMTVLYENIATLPIKYLFQIYDFLGLTVTKEIENYVFQNTMGGKQSNGYYETRRYNSTENAYHWQINLNVHERQLIETSCENFYNITKFYNL